MMIKLTQGYADCHDPIYLNYESITTMERQTNETEDGEKLECTLIFLSNRQQVRIMETPEEIMEIHRKEKLGSLFSNLIPEGGLISTFNTDDPNPSHD